MQIGQHMNEYQGGIRLVAARKEEDAFSNDKHQLRHFEKIFCSSYYHMDARPAAELMHINDCCCSDFMMTANEMELIFRVFLLSSNGLTRDS